MPQVEIEIGREDPHRKLQARGYGDLVDEFMIVSQR